MMYRLSGTPKSSLEYGSVTVAASPLPTYPLGIFNQRYQLTKNLGDITAIDFIDDQDIILLLNRNRSSSVFHSFVVKFLDFFV